MIRQIAKDAFKCEALFNQFSCIDVADRYLDEATEQCVSDTYSDAYLIREADYLLNRLVDEREHYASCSVSQDIIDAEMKQLRRFIAKWERIAK